MKPNVAALLLTFTLVSTLPACASYPPAYSAEAIEAWVVDAETKQPMEGVIVTANWELRGGASPGGSTAIGQLMVMETVTDKSGRFYFPAWGPIRQFRGGLLNDDPKLLFFKPGYNYLVLRNKFRDDMDTEPLRRSDWNGKTIELKPFKGTEEEYAEHVYRLSSDMDSMLDFARGAKNCNWKNTPRMLVALHKMSLHFEVQGIKLSGWRIGQRIHRIKDIPGDPHCVPVEEFFREYMQ